MSNTLRILVAAIVCIPCLLRAQEDVGNVLLNPAAIRITGQFETSPGPTSLELALRFTRKQMDEKRAADAAESPLEPLWKESFWKFFPADPAGTLNSPVGALPDRLARNPLHLDDPFCTPPYLTFRGRQLDHELARSEKQGLGFLSP